MQSSLRASSFASLLLCAIRAGTSREPATRVLPTLVRVRPLNAYPPHRLQLSTSHPWTEVRHASQMLDVLCPDGAYVFSPSLHRTEQLVFSQALYVHSLDVFGFVMPARLLLLSSAWVAKGSTATLTECRPMLLAHSERGLWICWLVESDAQPATYLLHYHCILKRFLSGCPNASVDESPCLPPLAG